MTATLQSPPDAAAPAQQRPCPRAAACIASSLRSSPEQVNAAVMIGYKVDRVRGARARGSCDARRAAEDAKKAAPNERSARLVQAGARPDLRRMRAQSRTRGEMQHLWPCWQVHCSGRAESTQSGSHPARATRAFARTKPHTAHRGGPDRARISNSACQLICIESRIHGRTNTCCAAVTDHPAPRFSSAGSPDLFSDACTGRDATTARAAAAACGTFQSRPAQGPSRHLA